MAMARGTALAVLMIASMAGCGNRAALATDGGNPPGVDGGSVRDLRPSYEQLPLYDAAPVCNEPLEMGLVSTFFDGVPSNVQTRTTLGHVIYHGEITTALSMSPLFDREIQFSPYAGSEVLLIQYYLPQGVRLPLVVGTDQPGYTFTIKRRAAQGGGMTYGLIIKGNTPGPWPYVLIAEPATYGQAFALSASAAQPVVDDPLIAPLTVTQLRRTDCLTTPSPGCAQRYVDRLRFEATTGAGLITTELRQGESTLLPLFGHQMRVVNLKSDHLPPGSPNTPGCPGAVRMGYLVLEAE